MKMLKRVARKTILTPLMVIGLISLYILYIFIALSARFFAKPRYDIALGPQPMINNIYHKRALELYGYKAKTFVFNTFFITQEFDFFFGDGKPQNPLTPLKAFIHTVFNHKILYTYFNGTISYMRFLPNWLQHIAFKYEPLLYKLAGLKLVLLPYGGDVHNLSYCNNLLMKNSIIKDYPYFQKQWRDNIITSTDAWIKTADHVIAGCDWVWFLYHWDTLLSGHFSIDTHCIQPQGYKKHKKGDLIKIFHGPNHVTIKGSKHFERAVRELKDDGYNIELVLVQKKHNDELLKIMQECDIIADQLIIGWYAMTAIEGMSMGKPVLCYLHEDLLNLYIEQEVIDEKLLPLINCNYKTVKSRLKELLDHPEQISIIGKKSREYVEKYHSLEFIGGKFDIINKSLGVFPTNTSISQ